MGKSRWGVIIDAGSSGSRVHVYRWKDPSQGVRADVHKLPKIKTKWTKKIRPGVSTFGEKPSEIGAEHLQSLVDYALDVVPHDMVGDTPIFLMATAGMRLLPQVQQTALLREMCSFLRQKTWFSLVDCASNIQVISGETEGLYGWLAANYLLGGFDHPEKHVHGPNNHHTYGFLDMGGASAQIAFAPNATEAAEHAADLKLVRLRTLDGQPAEHRVFTATWLGFGVNEARESYVKALVDRYYDIAAEGGDIPDPCLPAGLRTTLEGKTISDSSASSGKKRGDAAKLIGTGDFARCLVGTKPLLSHDTSCGSSAGSHPCLIHDPVPQIDFDINHFVGVSEYYHSTHGFFGEKGGDHAYDFATYERNVLAFCDRDWSTITADIEMEKADKKNSKSKDPEREMLEAQQACFKASWVINVLHEGIGIPRVGLDKGFNETSSSSSSSHEALNSPAGVAAFRPVNKVDSVEVSWTLGRMLLYASGQVPPIGGSSGSKELAPVGFGSNVLDGSIPTDFTYAGSSWEPLKIGGDDDDDDDDDDWGDDILEKARKKPASGGLALFVLIMVVLGFLLRKNDRRGRFFGRVGQLGQLGQMMWRTRWPGSPRSPRNKAGRTTLSSLTSKLFGGWYSRDYERVMEEGGLGGSNGSSPYDNAFELTDVSGGSDSRSSSSADDNYNNNNDGSDGGDGSTTVSASRLARTSGLATPQLSVVDSLFDSSGSGSALDRSGLVGRTESRERLTPIGGSSTSLHSSLHATMMMGGAGRRSRATSPTRLKSPLMTPLQED